VSESAVRRQFAMIAKTCTRHTQCYIVAIMKLTQLAFAFVSSLFVANLASAATTSGSYPSNDRAIVKFERSELKNSYKASLAAARSALSREGWQRMGHPATAGTFYKIPPNLQAAAKPLAEARQQRAQYVKAFGKDVGTFSRWKQAHLERKNAKYTHAAR